MTPDLVVFYVLAALAVLSAAGMILSRNVVYGILLMAVHFIVTAVFYLILQAPFLAAAQVIVYAGAIMVLFLFVVMLMGPQRLGLDEPLGGQRPMAAVMLLGFAAVLITAVAQGVPAASARVALESQLNRNYPMGFGSPASVGDLLFREHLLAFETVSILLLVAMIGAVVIGQAMRDSGGHLTETPRGASDEVPDPTVGGDAARGAPDEDGTG